MEPHYTRDCLPDDGWEEFSRSNTTKMVRIDGPFTITTKGEEVRCEDGWLALDSDGDPYPVDAQVHRTSYTQVSRVPEDTGVREVRVRPDRKAIAYSIPEAALKPDSQPRWGCFMHSQEENMAYMVLTDDQVQDWIVVFRHD